MNNLFLAVLPTIVIIAYILGFDKYNQEPPKLLLKLFVAGCFTVIPAIYLERMVDENSFYGYLGLFFYCVIGVALMEEGVKFVASYLLSYHDNAFDEIYDGIIYCVMVSLGFATIENIMYVMQYGQSTAIIRAITAVPAHAIFAVTMGYFVGMSKAYPNHRILYMVSSLVAPILLHAVYDFILFTGLNWLMLVFIVYVVLLYKQTFALIKRTSDIPPFN